MVTGIAKIGAAVVLLLIIGAQLLVLLTAGIAVTVLTVAAVLAAATYGSVTLLLDGINRVKIGAKYGE